ncbi:MULTISPECIES: DUF5626 family protein [unclassified Enterococcus]|uniref:DUF5626 family protein n=1 Tax=unclassified Enterococcus TaxID=2608891 RepID=UPI001CE0CE36|nr:MULTISPECIES: DUF5626 family protein [unclassified Enterococcus]MCA5013631.1 DUF5626 family protein [Enterococcus sp. S23]MCA5016881.1 DUF5626 family protein [Enterococcus sp. S22(2020)]
MKKVFILGIVVFLSLVSKGAVGYAEETPASITYPLRTTEKQISSIITEEGEELIITIEKEPSISRALGNGTYTVSTERKGSWRASYQLTIKNNSITTAKNAKAVAISGSFTSKSLRIDNTKQATYYLKRKVGTSTATINLRAKINGSRLNISVLT